MRDRRLLTLYLFYTVNFIAMGMTTFAPKFYGEIGLSDTRIGIISASMAAVALFAQPVWGALADRANYMRSVLAAALLVSGGLCFLVLPAMHSFLLLLAVLTLYNTFSLPAYPLSNAIAIEYTSRNGQSYGPVRMMGTVGYQAGILLTGLILSRSLMGLYPCIGITLFLAALCAILLPPVRGYQHSREKVSFAVLFRDRKMLLIFSVAFIANIAHQFNLTFFSRHLGDLGCALTEAQAEQLKKPDILRRKAQSTPEGFDIARYTREVFRMYDNEEPKEVTLLCCNEVMKGVLDKFGMDIVVKRAKKGHFRTKVQVCTSPTFYSWVFQWEGKIRIEGPEDVVTEYREMVLKALE